MISSFSELEGATPIGQPAPLPTHMGVKIESHERPTVSFMVWPSRETTDEEVRRLLRHHVVKLTPGAQGRLLKGRVIFNRPIKPGARMRPNTEIRVYQQFDLQRAFEIYAAHLGFIVTPKPDPKTTSRAERIKTRHCLSFRRRNRKAPASA